MRLFEINYPTASSDPRATDIEFEQYEHTWQKIQTLCSDALASYVQNNIGIWKGFDRMVCNDVIFTDPTASARKSKNTSNYYTLLLDNLPLWQAYPKRSRSLICSSSENVAQKYSMFSTPYLILPFNGAKIGVCPKSDIWASFKHWRYLPEINDTLARLHISEQSYAAMIEDIYNHSDSLAMSLNIPALATAATTRDIINIFNDVMDPFSNNFELITTSDLSGLDDSRECWTSSSAYMIKRNSKFMLKYLEGLF